MYFEKNIWAAVWKMDLICKNNWILKHSSEVIRATQAREARGLD
jgi:hypothetical protein